MSTYVAVFALILAYVATVAAFFALRTLARLRRDTQLLSRGTRGPAGQLSLIEVTQRHADTAKRIVEDIEELRAYVDHTSHELQAYVDGATNTLTGRVDTGRREAFDAVVERENAEAGALRNVALVRYDALTEMSGRMSFSLALLDDRGDGVTISAITGVSGTRVYAKSIAQGSGEHDLSPEESQAVSSALGDRRRFRKAG